MILYTSYIKFQEDGIRSQLQEQATRVLNNAADVAYRVAETYLMTENFDLQHGDIPPFMLSWMYMSVVHLINHGDAAGISQYDEKVNTITKALHKLSKKWNSACRNTSVLFMQTLTYMISLVSEINSCATDNGQLVH